MLQLPHPCDRLRGYANELDDVAENLNLYLDKTERLLVDIKGEYPSTQMECVLEMQDELMPFCRHLVEVALMVSQHMKQMVQLYDSIDEGIMNQIRNRRD